MVTMLHLRVVLFANDCANDCARLHRIPIFRSNVKLS